MPIPKILHFTWKTTDLPRVMGAYYEKWRALHPDWDIRLWTDDSMRAYVAEAHPDFLAVYDGYPKMIQRADVFRYLVLHGMGGIYADLDVEPFANVAPLLSYDCFVGVEPLEHIGPDRRHLGVPFLLTNAFMGAVPGHIMWRTVIDALPGLDHQDTMYATGPSVVTAVALRLARTDRPVILMPKVWSPLLSNGVAQNSDAALEPMMREIAEVVPADFGTLVSHKWMTTWVPWHKRKYRFEWVFQVPTMIKWKLRELRHKDLASVSVPSPIDIYYDQALAPVSDRPHVHVAVRLDGEVPSTELVSAIEALEYPSERLSVSYHASERGTEESSVWAQINRMLDQRPAVADRVLLIDGGIRSFPSDAILQMLAAKQPVVAGNCLTVGGENADPELFRYQWGANFKILYKSGGLDGAVRSDAGMRTYLLEQKVFRILPLDGVGTSFVMVDRKVLDGGVRFPETPYKLHRGGEGFGIMARDRGFEVSGLTGLTVVRG